MNQPEETVAYKLGAAQLLLSQALQLIDLQIEMEKEDGVLRTSRTILAREVKRMRNTAIDVGLELR